MKEFLAKVEEILNGLNESTLWAYLKSVINKIVALLGYYGEDEAATIVDLIPKA